MISREDGTMMMNGGRPEGCTCEMTSGVHHDEYSHDPAEWTILDDCPRHGDAPPECPSGCGCRWLYDADATECACDGPCCYAEWVTMPNGEPRPKRGGR